MKKRTLIIPVLLAIGFFYSCDAVLLEKILNEPVEPENPAVNDALNASSPSQNPDADSGTGAEQEEGTLEIPLVGDTGESSQGKSSIPAGTGHRSE
jgi:hypothetical protein